MPSWRQKLSDWVLGVLDFVDIKKGRVRIRLTALAIGYALFAIYWYHQKRFERKRREALRVLSHKNIMDLCKGRIQIGLDIGGTLAKLVYFEPDDPRHESKAEQERRLLVNGFLSNSLTYGRSGKRDQRLELRCDELGGTFHFIKFYSNHMTNFFKLINEHKLVGDEKHGTTHVYATGGGAHKYANEFKESIPRCLLTQVDEFDALLKGIDFLLRSCPDELYYYTKFRFDGEAPETNRYDGLSYPYMLVNIGTGVSMLTVDGPGKYTRVGGTALGGGTFLGLCRALTGCQSFEEALELASEGHARAIDLYVRDIYGGDYKRKGIYLPGSTVASCFGKLVRFNETRLDHLSRADLAKAALVMITNNIGSLANLYAHKVLQVPQIIFVGNFLTNNVYAKCSLAYACDYWSKGKTPALFLKHEGYFGAVGSIIQDSA